MAASSCNSSLFFSRSEFERYSYSHFAEFVHNFDPEYGPQTSSFEATAGPTISTEINTFSSHVALESEQPNDDSGTTTIISSHVPLDPEQPTKERTDSGAVSVNVSVVSDADQSAPSTLTRTVKHPEPVPTCPKPKKGKKKKKKKAKGSQSGNLSLPSKRFSNLTTNDHRLYLLWKTKFRSLARNDMTNDMKEELKLFHNLEQRVKKEQITVNRWRQNNPITFSLHPSVVEYVNVMLSFQSERVDDYPRYYVTKDQIAIIGQYTPMWPVAFQYLHSPLLLGTVPLLMLNKNAYKQGVPRDKLRYPPKPTQLQLTSGRLCKTVVSKDSNAETLALKNDVNIVASTGSIKTIFATSSLSMENAWTIPVIVSEYPQADGTIKKIVYLDKPLRKSSQAVFQRNHLFYKRAVKSSLLHPKHRHSFVFVPTSASGADHAPVQDLRCPKTLGQLTWDYNSQKKTATSSGGTESRSCQPTGFKDGTVIQNSPIGNDSTESCAASNAEAIASINAPDVDTVNLQNPVDLDRDTGTKIDEVAPKDSAVDSDRAKTPTSDDLSCMTLRPRRRVSYSSANDLSLSCYSELSDDSASENLVIDLPSDASSGPSSPSSQGNLETRLKSSNRSSINDKQRSPTAEKRKGDGSDVTESKSPARSTMDANVEELQPILTPERSVRRSARLIQRTTPNSTLPFAKIPTSSSLYQRRSVVDDVDTPEKNKPSVDSPDDVGDSCGTGETPILSTSNPESLQEASTPDSKVEYKKPENDSNVCYHLWKIGQLKVLVRGSVDGLMFSNARDTKKQFSSKNIRKTGTITTDCGLENENMTFYNISPKLEYNTELGGECLSFSECATEWISTALLPKGKLARVRINATTSKVVFVEQLDLDNVVPSYSQFKSTECLRTLANVMERVYKLPVGHYLLTHETGSGTVKILKANSDITRTSNDNVFDLHVDHRLMDAQQLSDSDIVELNAIDPEIRLLSTQPHIPGLFPPKSNR